MGDKNYLAIYRPIPAIKKTLRCEKYLGYKYFKDNFLAA